MTFQHVYRNDQDMLGRHLRNASEARGAQMDRIMDAISSAAAELDELAHHPMPSTQSEDDDEARRAVEEPRRVEPVARVAEPLEDALIAAPQRVAERVYVEPQPEEERVDEAVSAPAALPEEPHVEAVDSLIGSE
ncbi:MAG: hypothetical protein EOP20_09225, partial [Hyphomicrobiales bacterium]